jgi:hypothetical protein
MQSKFNTWDRSRKHEKRMRRSLTVTITLSPNTCDDPKTQKTSYRSSPHSIAAAVAKLPRESSCRSSVTIHTAMKLLRVKGAPDCLLATAAPTPTTHTAKTNIT